MHILDTDTLTHLHAGNQKIQERLQACEDPDVCTTVITKIEILRGRMDFVLKADSKENLLRAQQLLTRTEELLEQIFVVTIDVDAAVIFGQLRANSSLRKIGRADLLIASITLASRATLVTRNVKHFKQISNLNVVNWVD
jgi:tRNA(fMet)-specific endonuclease VapC